MTNLEKIGFDNILPMNRKTNYEKRNQSSVGILVQSFFKKFKKFHLPTLPSIEKLSDVSRNVTLEVQRELEENFERHSFQML